MVLMMSDDNYENDDDEKDNDNHDNDFLDDYGNDIITETQ